jgi:RsiW-degrading membrane proteinase PrsW (M82 family)
VAEARPQEESSNVWNIYAIYEGITAVSVAVFLVCWSWLTPGPVEWLNILLLWGGIFGFQALAALEIPILYAVTPPRRPLPEGMPRSIVISTLVIGCVACLAKAGIVLTVFHAAVSGFVGFIAVLLVHFGGLFAAGFWVERYLQ